MKTMKKIIALLIAMMMVLSMTTALAATIVVETGATASDGTESQDVLEGETYSAYKILNYTSDTTVSPAAYSYYLTADQYEADADGKAVADGLGDILEKAGFKFQVSADNTQYVLTNADEIVAADVATYLYTNKTKVAAKAIAKSENKTASADKEVVFSNLETGYWFVTSSLGALCSLQSYDDEALIVEKNQTLVPPPKTVSDPEAQVGDILTYTVTLTDVKGTNLKAQIVDTMSEGLTYNDDAELVATVGGEETTLTKGNQYTETSTTDADGNTVITWEITADQMTAMDVGDTIVVTYTATVNEKASIDGTEFNTAITRYSEQETDGEEVPVETTNLTVNKKDPKENALKGAKFELYRTDADANPAADHVIVMLTEMTEAEILKALGKDADGNQIQPDATTHYYKVDPDSTNKTIDLAVKDGDDYIYSSARIFGLDKDSTYYLLETKSPEGYNLLDGEIEVAPGLNTIDVTNEAGTVLPSTGGIGTTILYIVGSLLVLGAGVVLVTKRRMN